MSAGYRSDSSSGVYKNKKVIDQFDSDLTLAVGAVKCMVRKGLGDLPEVVVQGDDNQGNVFEVLPVS